MTTKVKERRCPCCGGPVVFEGNPYRPFCSKRCKLSDLRAWFKQEYIIVTDTEQEPGGGFEQDPGEECGLKH